VAPRTTLACSTINLCIDCLQAVLRFHYLRVDTPFTTRHNSPSVIVKALLTMSGTVVLTGANGSAAVWTVRYLLKHHLNKHLVLTVRDTSDSDVNTKLLKEVISEYPDARFCIRALDLSDLAAVHAFAKTLADEVSRGKVPRLESIICNAFYWNLASEKEMTSDGYEKTFQVNHIAHSVLVLRLLGSFAASGGRVVLLTSDAHWPGKNSLEKIPPKIPSSLDELARPPSDQSADHLAKGQNHYALSKLTILMWMYALNRRLQKVCSNIVLLEVRLTIVKDPPFSHITAVAINPGNMSDSRALRVNTPPMLQMMSKYFIQPMRPLLRFADPTMRTSSEAGTDIAKLAVNEASPGARGFFTLLKEDISSPDSLNEQIQEDIWEKTLEWTGISKGTDGIPA
jgi:NAD(P)-dependent dehydrogenase (short-subunit alcohol dehydrogenase family)